MELATLVQTALVLYLPAVQHRILTELMKGMIAVFDDHRTQLFQKFPEIIRSVAEKACADIEVVACGVRELKHIDWNEAVVAPSAYMDGLIKKIEVLLSQLKPILPESQIQVWIVWQFHVDHICIDFGRIDPILDFAI